MLKRLFKRDSGATRADKITYTEARDALETHNIEARRDLAQRHDVEPEILYYLAEDSTAEIRQLVAANPTTPQQANLLLTDDAEDEVRCELSRKVVRLLPDLQAEDQIKTLDLAIEVLEKLADDHLPRVRQLLAEEIKDSLLAPRSVIKKLAKDLEEIVCVPIIEYSPLLSDEDLLEIIATAQVKGAIQAVSRRQEVSGDVSDAVVATLDVSAIADLLANPNAQIREDTLDEIIDNAESIETWHQPLVMRNELSVRAIRRIAGFVATSLITALAERNELDEKIESELKARLKSRIATSPMIDETIDEETDAVAVAKSAFEQGKLDADFMRDAVDAGDAPLVSNSLALLTGLSRALVDRVLTSKNGKGITSLTWKAGLPMRIAYSIQMKIAKLPANQLIPAKNGVHYPLSEEEMTWHLDYFGIK